MKTRIHMIGIGGVGMSAIAVLLARRGCVVTGSDRESSYLTTLLASGGIAVQLGHEPDLIRTADLVVYSSAIRPDNPERVWALEHGVRLVRRAEMLGDLMRSMQTIGVSGTHGKTTTTSLIGHIFDKAGMSPTVLVGGVMRDCATNTLCGSSDVMIVEADEYDRSFLALYPQAAIVTNIDADHLDCYRDIDEIEQAFALYVQRLPWYGHLVLCADDPRAAALAKGVRCQVTTYGVRSAANYRAIAVEPAGGGMRYDLHINATHSATVQLPLPGEHNVLNSLAALAMSASFGIDTHSAVQALSTFGGVKRRFEIVGVGSGVTIIDDYAHHPGEIRATLAAARGGGYARIVAVFQPHLYTRTRDHLDAFAAVLGTADLVVVAPIYKAREEAIEGVSAAAIVQRLSDAGHPLAFTVQDASGIAGLLLPRLQAGDAVVVMGAGDIWKTAAALLEALQ